MEREATVRPRMHNETWSHCVLRTTLSVLTKAETIYSYRCAMNRLQPTSAEFNIFEELLCDLYCRRQYYVLTTILSAISFSLLKIVDVVIILPVIRSPDDSRKPYILLLCFFIRPTPTNNMGVKCPSARTYVRTSVRPQKVFPISKKFGM